MVPPGQLATGMDDPMLAATSAKEGLSTSPAAAGGALDTASMLMSSAPALLTTASSSPRRRGDVDDDDEPERPRALAARKERCFELRETFTVRREVLSAPRLAWCDSMGHGCTRSSPSTSVSIAKRPAEAAAAALAAELGEGEKLPRLCG
jgi:hypothetical protein|tara:strand:- start:31 stop:480 length:450 start_codon:yes stop_codon:yes gene_type:complete